MMPPLTPAFLSFFLFAGASLFLAGESRADDGVMLDSIMAVVNHHSITKSEVDRELKPTFEKIHATYQGPAYLQLVASLEYNVMMKKINERLELEEADRLGLSVTDDEVDHAIDDIMQKNNIQGGGSSRTPLPPRD
jgi:SurA N-terminal domain.